MSETPAERTLLVIIPAYNEEAAIAGVVCEIRATVPEVPVLVINDASADATATVARDAGALVMSLPHHLGLGGAVQAGYRLAFELGYQYVIRLDGDGQHDPRFIPKIYETLLASHCEMVIASRFLDGEFLPSSLVRGLGIRFFRLVLRPILGKEVRDPTSGYVGVNRAALQVFSKSFPLEYPEIETLVVLQRKAFRFVEIPCEMRARMAGRSTITPLKSLYYIFHVLMGVFMNILKYEGRRKRR
ncbi:MAG TPA: glycosyltransferase family 2 protein [Bryobacteraceae bacterium]|nr:glycosyltransferase family 2 protein [Bryobacteraceae bacterium]